MNITKENTVAEIVSKKLGSDHVFNKYKIDFCCGGNMTLEAACKENKVDFEMIMQEIETINIKIGGEYNLKDMDISSLIEKLKEEYHNYLDENVSQIVPISTKVAEVHGLENPEVIEINVLIKGIEIVVLEMLKNTNNTLFPIIEKILTLDNISADISENQIEIVKRTVKKSEIAHQLVSDTFKEISNLSSHYLVPDGACNSYRFLYQKLHELDHQLQKYVHFNTHVFIPKILKIVE